MVVIAVIQARMGSTRLPGKVLKDIGGASMLARVVRRTQRASRVHGVVVATTVEEADDAVVSEVRKLGVPIFRGDEQDVLDRYYQTALTHKAEAVVRITSDCPLIDPEVIDRIVVAFLDKAPDYASNSLIRTYPRGLDVEVMTLESLAVAWREAREFYQRSHVTPYIYQHAERFRILAVTNDVDFSSHRWTVDTPEDFEFVTTVYARLGNSETFTWGDVLAILEREPGLVELNHHTRQKVMQEG